MANKMRTMATTPDGPDKEDQHRRVIGGEGGVSQRSAGRRAAPEEFFQDHPHGAEVEAENPEPHTAEPESCQRGQEISVFKLHEGPQSVKEQPAGSTDQDQRQADAGFPAAKESATTGQPVSQVQENRGVIEESGDPGVADDVKPEDHGKVRCRVNPPFGSGACPLHRARSGLLGWKT
jgi:hypothetical protein